MEILNNLWLAVSTPNETLIDVIAVPSIIIESFLMLFLSVSILNISTSLKQKITFTIFTSIIGLLNMYFLPDAFNIIFNYIILLAL